MGAKATRNWGGPRANAGRKPGEHPFCGWRLSVRLDDESFERFEAYCKRRNLSPSEAVREILARLEAARPTGGGTRRW
jgi:hypothetical protein